MFSIGRLSLVQLIRMSAGLITEGVLDTQMRGRRIKVFPGLLPGGWAVIETSGNRMRSYSFLPDELHLCSTHTHTHICFQEECCYIQEVFPFQSQWNICIYRKMMTWEGGQRLSVPLQAVFTHCQFFFWGKKTSRPSSFKNPMSNINEL